MKTIVTVESFDAMVERKLERARKLDAHVAIVPERRISFERPEDMVSFLAGPRMRVLAAAMEKPRSVTELALALKRNRSAVSRDVRALLDHGMITVTKKTNPGHGKVTIVRSVARQFDLRARITAQI